MRKSKAIVKALVIDNIIVARTASPCCSVWTLQLYDTYVLTLLSYMYMYYTRSKFAPDFTKGCYTQCFPYSALSNQVSLCKAIRKYCQSEDDLLSWESTLASLLEAHPELGESSCSSEEESESQGMDELSSDPPSSLPSSGEWTRCDCLTIWNFFIYL